MPVEERATPPSTALMNVLCTELSSKISLERKVPLLKKA